MQVLSPLRFKVESKEEMVLQALLDKNCRSILSATSKNSRSASEISSDCSIPLSSVYRRIRFLKDCGLLDVSCRIRYDGKKAFLYKKRTTTINTIFGNDQLKVQMILSQI